MRVRERERIRESEREKERERERAIFFFQLHAVNVSYFCYKYSNKRKAYFCK